MGRANAGKTALFRLLTGAEAEVAPYPFTTREPARAMADVPDPRLHAIADAQDIPRRVPAQVQVVDIAGLAAGAGTGEGLGGAALGQLRQMDALIHVVRAFANAEVPHPEDAIDALADAEAIDLELIVADRDVVERRRERTRKGARAGEAGAAAELAALDLLAEALDAGRPARMVDDPAAAELSARMELLTAKPILYLANTDESLEPPADLAAHAAALGAEALALPVELERELAEMDPDEAAELARDMELGDVRGADAVVAAAYRLLDLVTFFTGSGPPEARAWPIRRGTSAAVAAGKIHSDLERGFIRAETIGWDDLVAAGSWAKAKENATLRMEGRDYLVQEGDVIQVRFNV